MIDLGEHAEGVLLPVRAQPGARSNAIRGERAGALQVAVTQAPEKGKANRAIIAVLAEGLGLRKSQLDLLSGETSSEKRFLVREITQAELAKRIAAVVAS